MIVIQTIDEFDTTIFQAWLEVHKEDEVVGQTASAERCPLANCLTDVLGNGNPWTGGFSARSDRIRGKDRAGNYVVVDDLPDWIALFIHELDEDEDLDIEVTREDCERVLEHVCG